MTEASNLCLLKKPSWNISSTMLHHEKTNPLQSNIIKPVEDQGQSSAYCPSMYSFIVCVSPAYGYLGTPDIW